MVGVTPGVRGRSDRGLASMRYREGGRPIVKALGLPKTLQPGLPSAAAWRDTGWQRLKSGVWWPGPLVLNSQD